MLATTVSHQILVPMYAISEAAHKLMADSRLSAELRRTVLKILVSSKLGQFFANDVVDNQAFSSKHFTPVLKHTSLEGNFLEVIFIV